jgi:hypothetical protein
LEDFREKERLNQKQRRAVAGKNLLFVVAKRKEFDDFCVNRNVYFIFTQILATTIFSGTNFSAVLRNKRFRFNPTVG